MILKNNTKTLLMHKRKNLYAVFLTAVVHSHNLKVLKNVQLYIIVLCNKIFIIKQAFFYLRSLHRLDSQLFVLAFPTQAQSCFLLLVNALNLDSLVLTSPFVCHYLLQMTCFSRVAGKNYGSTIFFLFIKSSKCVYMFN